MTLVGHNSQPMKGKILYEGTELAFANIAKVSIVYEGKPWVYEHCTATQLRFRPAELGGYAGIGNWLKAWRKRHGPKFTQEKAANLLGVSQSFIAKIEKGEKNMPGRIFRKIQKDVLKYGPAKPWGE